MYVLQHTCIANIKTIVSKKKYQIEEQNLLNAQWTEYFQVLIKLSLGFVTLTT